MRRLALKLPTILQITASSVLLFHEAGVSEIMHHSDHSTFYEMRFPPKQNLSRLWALVDTNENLPQPAPIFKRASPFYVINAVSPRSGNLQWTKKIGQKTFYMEPWSICEVLQAYADLTPGDSQHSHSAVVLSLVKIPAQNISSGICTINLAHPPGPWLCMPMIRRTTKHSSTMNSAR